ncbi:hypothetical protein MD484_g3495, partial [Candolleomyces efflorescens]
MVAIRLLSFAVAAALSLSVSARSYYSGDLTARSFEPESYDDLALREPDLAFDDENFDLREFTYDLAVELAAREPELFEKIFDLRALNSDEDAASLASREPLDDDSLDEVFLARDPEPFILTEAEMRLNFPPPPPPKKPGFFSRVKKFFGFGKAKQQRPQQPQYQSSSSGGRRRRNPRTK